MPDRQLITLEEAQTAAEQFLQERLKGLRKLSIDKVRLSSVESIVIYEVEGTATIGNWFIFRSIERPFKLQVSAGDGAVVGFE